MPLRVALYEEAQRARDERRDDQRVPDRRPVRRLEIAGDRGDTEAEEPTRGELDRDERADVETLDGARGQEDVDGERARAYELETIARELEVAARAREHEESKRRHERGQPGGPSRSNPEEQRAEQ